MKLLLDAHVLLWAMIDQDRLAGPVGESLDDPANETLFSVVSLWEIVFKRARGRSDFTVDPAVLHGVLSGYGYIELLVSAEHALAVGSLPPIHKDPFDRMLVAQTTVEGALLLTADAVVQRYPGPIRGV